MELIVADVSDRTFAIDTLLEEQVGIGYLAFSNMNKSGAGVCNFFLENTCPKGNMCPYRHIKGDRTIVCKHWLRGLCKKGDNCEFLHEFDMTKMPECYFYSRYGECMNKECPFLHVDPQTKMQDCPWYDRGFCRNGPLCKNRHVRRIACSNYINGFCPKGKECLLAHPKWWPLPGTESFEGQRQKWVCHHCKERGHKIQFCLKLSPEERHRIQQSIAQRHQHMNSIMCNLLAQNQNVGSGNVGQGNQMGPKPLDQVTCYKCGELGHYANRCSKGYLAFLSKVSNVSTEQSGNKENTPSVNSSVQNL